jgi:hypothetical protein
VRGQGLDVTVIATDPVTAIIIMLPEVASCAA